MFDEDNDYPKERCLIGEFHCCLSTSELRDWDDYCRNLPQYSNWKDNQVEIRIIECALKANDTIENRDELRRLYRHDFDLLDELKKIAEEWYNKLCKKETQ